MHTLLDDGVPGIHSQEHDTILSNPIAWNQLCLNSLFDAMTISIDVQVTILDI